MYREKKVYAVIMACNEGMLLADTLQNMPEYIDHIVVVDDCSTDHTPEIVKKFQAKDHRILSIRHEKSLGEGAAIRTGYIWCRDHGADIAVVMNGTSHMDPGDLPGLLNPVVDNHADYTKGNRLITGEAWRKIPHIRYIGNSILTLFTKFVSGYWHVTDSQSAYTAINRKALHLIPLETIYPGYGVQNDILVTLNIYNMRVMDIPVNPFYGTGEKERIGIPRIIYSFSILLVRLFFRRMFQKYVIRDFHPLIFFYALGFFVMLLDIPIIIRLFVQWKITGFIPTINALTILFCTFTSLQLILFAMLFDMEANKELKGNDYTHTR